MAAGGAEDDFVFEEGEAVSDAVVAVLATQVGRGWGHTYQIRGPSMKVKILLHPWVSEVGAGRPSGDNQRSGRNSLASTPHISSERFIARMGMTTVVPVPIIRCSETRPEVVLTGALSGMVSACTACDDL